MRVRTHHFDLINFATGKPHHRGAVMQDCGRRRTGSRIVLQRSQQCTDATRFDFRIVVDDQDILVIACQGPRDGALIAPRIPQIGAGLQIVMLWEKSLQAVATFIGRGIVDYQNVKRSRGIRR